MIYQRSRVYIVAAVLLTLTGTARAAEGHADGIRVLRSDEQSFVFEYTPVFSPLQTVTTEGDPMVLLTFAGAIPVQGDSTTGAPDLRYAAFPLGFPAESGNAVQVIAADYEDIPNILFAPVPRYRIHDDMVEVDGYRVDPERYRASVFIPARVASLSSVGASRSMLLGSVHVFPVQYNPATRTIRKYTRLVLEVVYGTPHANRVQNQDDLLFGRTLLNYNVARSWKFGRLPGLARVTAAPSVLASGEWYRITVAEEGVYSLSAQYLASLGINTAAIDPRTIRVYGNGGTELPENIVAPRPVDLVENAIYVEGESDGVFDAADYVLFFGKGARGWTYNVATGVLNHYLNHYSEVNYYWLTFGGAGGKRMQTQASLPDTPILIPSNFPDGIAIEEETTNLLSSGKDWYGHGYGQGASFTYVNTLPGLVPGDVITYRYSLIARSDNAPAFTITENGQQIGSHGLPTICYSCDGNYASRGDFQVTGTSSLPNNSSRLSFSFSSGSAAGSGWNDWIEILYPRRFEGVNNYLRFRSPNVTGVVEYRLEQLSSPFILNVTQFDDVRRITGAVGSYTFRTAETAGQISEYCAAGSGSFKLPAGVTRVENQDLRGLAGGYDFIILTVPEFGAAAERLRAFREQPAQGNLRTIVVDVNKIYNEFGGGIPDITAVRDFVKYAYDNWTPQPRFVLMLGQASYDYKGRNGRSSYVPTWQSAESRNDISSHATDDFFVALGSGWNPFLVNGRLSARSQEEAEVLVDKVIRYGTSSARDGWSTKMLFVADDRMAVGLEDPFSARHAKAVADLTPDEFEKRQIYTGEYPTVNSAQGRRKPGAYQAIIDEINRGVLAVNYAGHGNPAVWAHESIFVVQTSIPQLVNADKLSVFIAATCNFSQFDDLSRRTGSEVLMNKPDGGAVAVISATRKVYAHENQYLHEGIFRQLFGRDTLTRLNIERPATAMFRFKTTSNTENSRKFVFLGDPSMKFIYPERYATIDSINGRSVGDTLREIKALARVTVKGTVRDAQNQPDPGFNGTATLIVNDASQSVTFNETPPGDPFTYTRSGGTIFRGQSSIRDGQFTATFVVPKDIAYADSTTRGRVVTYFTSASTDGAGYTGSVRVGGTEAAALDTTGPSMTIYVNSRNFRPGDMVSEDPVLYVDLVDSNGINTSVSGLGHRIEAWVNNSPQSRDVTEFYSSKLDNYREGTVQYSLTGLPLGRNVVRVRAWDTHNNATSGEAVFDVASSQQLRISEVMNYPNPFAGGTSFTFKQNQQTSLNVAVKIYTLAGRLIQSLETIAPGDPFVRIPWNGRDRDGDVLANGVYLYKVIVRTTDGRFASETLGKLSVVK